MPRLSAFRDRVSAEAEHHLTVALHTDIEMTARPWIAYTQHDCARILLHRNEAGECEHAQHLLNAASSTFDRLDMRTWAQRTWHVA
jgi:hypothetical protein